MTELLLFIAIAFGMGLAHQQDADVRWDKDKSRVFYQRLCENCDDSHWFAYNGTDIWWPPQYEPDPVTPVEEDQTVLIRQPDGTYKVCTLFKGAMYCHPVL